jgi:peptide/nickel transport system substrate-binding protein
MKRPLILAIFGLLILGAFLVLTLSGSYNEDKNTLRLPLPSNPKTLDPAGITDVYSDAVAQRIYNCLVKHSPTLQIEPDLAQSWEVSNDGLTYTFRLRKNVLFHHGRAMTSDDVIFSLARLADPRVSRKRELVEDIVGANAYGKILEKYKQGQKIAQMPDLPAGLMAPDPHTVVIKLKRRWPLFLHQLAMSPCSIIPRDEMTRLGKDFANNPVGTGPFQVEEILLNDRINLARFDKHFAGQPKIKKLRYQIIKDSLVRYQSYLAGELDMTDVPLGKSKEALARPDLHTWSQLNTFYLGIAMTKDPCGRNLHLRRALNYAIDRERLCRVTMEGRAVPAKGILPPGLPGYDPDLPGYSYDPAAVKRELAAAGYPEGKNLPEIALSFDPRNDGKPIAIEIRQQLKKQGIKIELREMDFNTLLDLTAKNPPPLYRLAWVADFPDPDNFLYVLFHSSMIGGSNRVHYNSKATDKLLDTARNLPMGPERIAAYQKAEAQIVADAPWLFLYHRGGHLLINPQVKGVTLTPLDSGVELPQADFINISKESSDSGPEKTAK